MLYKSHFLLNFMLICMLYPLLCQHLTDNMNNEYLVQLALDVLSCNQEALAMRFRADQQVEKR